MCMTGSALAADVTAICKLADDKRTVTVAFTNPETKTMQCEVNCRDPNGTPVTPADEKAEEEEADAMIKKLQKQGQDFIDQQRKLQK